MRFCEMRLGFPVAVGFGWGKSGNRGVALKFCGYPRTIGVIEQVVYYWSKVQKRIICLFDQCVSVGTKGVA